MSKEEDSINVSGYDRWSSFYDHYPNPTVAIDELVFPTLWQHLASKRVLEIGCGTGRHTRKLCALGNQVTAIDPSPGMLRIAREKCATYAVTFIEGDFLRHEFGRQRFDVALTSLVLEHIENVSGFFRTTAALLSPAGELFVSELHPARTARGTFAHFRDPQSDNEVHLQSYPHTREQIERAAEDAGFTLVSCQDAVGSDLVAELKPGWEKYLGQPMLQLWHWRLR